MDPRYASGTSKFGMELGGQVPPAKSEFQWIPRYANGTSKFGMELGGQVPPAKSEFPWIPDMPLELRNSEWDLMPSSTRDNAPVVLGAFAMLSIMRVYVPKCIVGMHACSIARIPMTPCLHYLVHSLSLSCRLGSRAYCSSASLIISIV